jgi:nicotinamide riboside kinase
VIAICGCSCSGKTTLAARLAPALGAPAALQQDDSRYDCRRAAGRRHHCHDTDCQLCGRVGGRRSWEGRANMDFAQLVTDIDALAATHHTVVVEGYSLLWDAELRRRVRLVLWLDHSDADVLARRADFPADDQRCGAGGAVLCARGWPTAADYTRGCLLPEHRRYTEHVHSVLGGTLSEYAGRAASGRAGFCVAVLSASESPEARLHSALAASTSGASADPG